MKFSNLIGNRRIVDYFERALTRGHLGHAYLFSGPEGIGKSSLARAICKALLCKNRTENGPCDECASCHKFDHGNHPDFHFYEPEGLYFKIELVREIIHQASLKPVESSWKTFLLEDIDYMRDVPANAFLKVLEEPPGQTIFFLISERSEVLLPTIRSRCQSFEFQPLSSQEIRDWLIHAHKMDPEQAALLSLSTHGSPGKALEVNAEKYRETRDRVLLALECAVLPKTYFMLIDSLRGITMEKREEMPERLLILEELTRDVVLLHASSTSRLVHEDARPRLLAIAAEVDQRVLSDFYEDLMQAREAILKINAHVGLTLQALFLELKSRCEIRRTKSA